MSTTDLDLSDNLDLEEPPSTDPSPGASAPVLSRIDNAEDDLETRLAWLAAEVRSTSAEHAKKKRAESILEAREYKTAVVPVPTRIPTDIDLPKISIALGVDPQREPTLVTRRVVEIEGDFDISDPEELSRTLPLDPNAPVADPLPFHLESNTRRPARRSKLVMAMMLFVGIFGGILVGALLPRSWASSIDETRSTAIPEAKKGANIIAAMTEQFYRVWLADLARLAQEADDPPEILQSANTEATSAPLPARQPAKRYTPFTLVKPEGSAQNNTGSIFRKPLGPAKPQPIIYQELGI